MRERGTNVCDQSAARDDCLNAWLLPLDKPPEPLAHTSIESFFTVQIERGDILERRMLAAPQSQSLRPDDLAVEAEGCRLRATADWLVMEAASEMPPCLVIGADDRTRGMRGLSFYYDAKQAVWLPLKGVSLPSETVILGEIVKEKLGDGSLVERVHAWDAAMIAGDDMRRLAYSERRRRLQFLVSALARDSAAVPQQQPFYSRDPACTALRGTAVRLKPTFTLHQLPQAVSVGRDRISDPKAEAQWPCFGLLLFPGHAMPALPLDPPHEWKKEWSKSQSREYWHVGGHS